MDEIDTKAKLVDDPTRAHEGMPSEHRVPLSARALQILEALPREGEFVFIGARANRPLSNMALLETLRRIGHGAPLAASG